MSDRELKLSVVLNAVDRMTAPLKAVIGHNKELASSFKKARDAAKELESQQKLIDKFRSTNKSIGIRGNELKEAQDRLNKLRAEMDASPVTTKRMENAFQRARQEVYNLKGTITNLKQSKQNLRAELSKVGIDTKKLSDAQANLKSYMSATNAEVDKQSKLMDKANQRMGQYRAAVARADKLRAIQAKAAGVGMGMAASGAAVTAATMLPVKAYADAEEAATQLKVAMMQKGGAIPQSFKQINDLANTLGNRLPGTTADYQNMMTMLVRQGMSAQAIIGGLGEATAYLAVQLQMPTTAAAEFASKLQDATKTSEKDMMALMDTIQRTFYLGVDSNNMLQAYSKFSSAMGMLRMSGAAAADAMAPLIVMADQQSLVGESAGNAFRKVFQYAISLKRVKDANAELNGTGIKLNFADKNGNFAGIDNMLKQLEKLKGLGDQKKGTVLKELFGDDAETLQAVHMMIDKGRAGYAETQAKMAAQADIQRRVNEQLGTLKNLWDAASGTFTNALVAFGASIAPDLHATAKWLGEVAAGVQSWAQNNPELAGTLMTVGKYLGLILTVGGALALVVSAILGPFAILITTLGALGITIPSIGVMIAGLRGGIMLLWTLIRANPLTFLISLLAAGLVGALTTLISKWDEIVEKFRQGNFWDIGVMLIQGLINGLDSATFGLLSKASEIVSSVISVFKKGLGINSPSRVFAEFGGYTMEGFGVGLTDGQRDTVATMRRVMAGVAAAGSVALSPASMAGTGTSPIKAGGQQAQVVSAGDTYQFYIQPSPGMDEAALADLVARKVDELNRQRGATKRSSLRDRD